MRPLFVDSVYGALYRQTKGIPIGKVEHKEMATQGAGPDGTFRIFMNTIRWVNGPAGNWDGPMIELKADDKTYALELSESADKREAGVLLHMHLLQDCDIPEVAGTMTQLIARYDDLTSAATSLHSTIADFRAH